MARRVSHEIVVVGAGPVGKTAALLLAGCGTRVLLLEARASDDISTVESKAIRLAPSTLQVFDKLGIADVVRREGSSWIFERVSFQDQDLFVRQTVSSDKPFINLPQWRTDELLLQLVLESPFIDLSYSTCVEGITQQKDHVVLQITGLNRAEEITASYVIACDGARSTARRLLSIPFDGHDYSDQFLIVDVEADLPHPVERRFLFSPSVNPNRQVMLMRQHKRLWRVDFQIGEIVQKEDAHLESWVSDRMAVIVGSNNYDVRWISPYLFSCRMVRSQRAGRILLAGDAAHVVSPFGGRGLNAGVVDVASAVPIISAAISGDIHGDAVGKALDQWASYRRDAAADHLAQTDAAMQFMLPRTAQERARRDRILLASRSDRKQRALVNTGRPFREQRSIQEFLATTLQSREQHRP